MITLNGYPDVNDGESLAAKANAVLENYQKHQARVLTTNSVPRTAERPAEHLIAVVVCPAKVHRGRIRPVPAGGWARMLLRLFPPDLWGEDGGRGERLAKSQRSGD